MGQKTNPIGLRLGINRPWDSQWFDEKNFATTLKEDHYIRKYLRERLSRAGVSMLELERSGDKNVTIRIHTSRPGIVIGRKGADIEQLRSELRNLTGKKVEVKIHEIKYPELDARLVAQNIAQQLQEKVGFRRALKKAIRTTMRMGAEGIKVACAGRLGGAEMARREGYHDGRVPLHTLRENIDFAQETAHTDYGCIGVKVWICKNDKAIPVAPPKTSGGRGRGKQEKK